MPNLETSSKKSQILQYGIDFLIKKSKIQKRRFITIFSQKNTLLKDV